MTPANPSLNAIRLSLALCVSCFMTGASLASAPLSVPLDRADGWQVLSYSSITPHEVEFTAEGMTIDVRNSASPIIYPIEPQTVSSLTASVEITGDLNLKSQTQGTEGNDDFLFRIGLVYEGEQTLNFIQRSFAASWVKTLFDLAPEGTGVDRIQFFNVYSDPSLANSEQDHPLSELMRERQVAYLPAAGGGESREVRFDIQPPTDRRVLALWLSSDGDDTQSSFRVTVREIVLR